MMYYKTKFYDKDGKVLADTKTYEYYDALRVTRTVIYGAVVAVVYDSHGQECYRLEVGNGTD